MDAVDTQLLELLAEDGRASFTQLAAQVKLSTPAVKRRIDRLERTGVIRGYRAVIDENAIGPATEALVEVFCGERTGRRELASLIKDRPEVTMAFTVAGESDAVLLLRTRDAEHLERVLMEIRAAPVVLRTRAQVILSQIQSYSD